MALRLAEIQIENGEHIITLRNEISQEEVTEFYNSLKPASEYKFMKHMFRITTLNGDELSSFIKNLSHDNRSLSKTDAENIVLEGNRLVANYCSFICMFVDHLEKTLTSRCRENLTGLREFTNYLYDNKFEYRFFVMLRNFIMHYSLPYTLLNEDFTGKRIEFSKNHLLTFSGWKHVKLDIEKMGEKIDIMPYIDPMNSALSDLLSTFLYYMAEDIILAYQSAGNFIRKYNLKNPAIARYDSVDELKKGHITFTPIEVYDLASVMEDIKNHPKINMNITNIPI